MLAAGLGARTDAVEYSVFGSNLQTDNREPNNENKTSTVSGTGTQSMSIGRLGAVPRPRRVRPHRHAGTTAFGRPDMDALFPPP